MILQQVGELAGIAAGGTVMLNILVAGYVRSLALIRNKLSDFLATNPN